MSDLLKVNMQSKSSKTEELTKNMYDSQLWVLQMYETGTGRIKYLQIPKCQIAR